MSFWKSLKKLFAPTPPPRVLQVNIQEPDSIALVAIDGKTVQFRGEGTMWHEYSTGQRAASWLESMLWEKYQAAKWEPPCI